MHLTILHASVAPWSASCRLLTICCVICHQICCVEFKLEKDQTILERLTVRSGSESLYDGPTLTFGQGKRNMKLDVFSGPTDHKLQFCVCIGQMLHPWCSLKDSYPLRTCSQHTHVHALPKHQQVLLPE